MGLFSKHKEKQQWLTIDSIEQLDHLLKKSFSIPQIIFKHSTRCSISNMAKNRMEEGLLFIQELADVYYLDLLAYRSISNEIAHQWKVEHESPQVIIIKNGEAIHNASHNMIMIDEIKKVLSN